MRINDNEYVDGEEEHDDEKTHNQPSLMWNHVCQGFP